MLSNTFNNGASKSVVEQLLEVDFSTASTVSFPEEKNNGDISACYSQTRSLQEEESNGVFSTCYPLAVLSSEEKDNGNLSACYSQTCSLPDEENTGEPPVIQPSTNSSPTSGSLPSSPLAELQAPPLLPSSDPPQEGDWDYEDPVPQSVMESPITPILDDSKRHEFVFSFTSIPLPVELEESELVRCYNTRAPSTRLRDTEPPTFDKLPLRSRLVLWRRASQNKRYRLTSGLPCFKTAYEERKLEELKFFLKHALGFSTTPGHSDSESDTSESVAVPELQGPELDYMMPGCQGPNPSKSHRFHYTPIVLDESEKAYVHDILTRPCQGFPPRDLSLYDTSSMTPLKIYEEIIYFMIRYVKAGGDRGLYYNPKAYIIRAHAVYYDPEASLSTNIYHNLERLLSQKNLLPHLDMYELLAFVFYVYGRIYDQMIVDGVIPDDPEFQSVGALPPLLPSKNENVTFTSSLPSYILAGASVAATVSFCKVLLYKYRGPREEPISAFPSISEMYQSVTSSVKRSIVGCFTEKTKKGHISGARLVHHSFDQMCSEVHPHLYPIIRLLGLMYQMYTTPDTLSGLLLLLNVDPAILDFVQDRAHVIQEFMTTIKAEGLNAFNSFAPVFRDDTVPHFQSDSPSIVAAMAEVFQHIMGFGSTTQSHLGACIKALTRFTSLVAAGKALHTIIASMKDSLLAIYSELLTTVSIHFDEDFIPIEKAREKMKSLLATILNTAEPMDMTTDECTDALLSRDILARFIIKNCENPRYHNYVKELRNLVQLYDKNLRKANLGKLASVKPVRPPVTIFLVGGPKTGKTETTLALARYVHSLYTNRESEDGEINPFAGPFNISMIWQRISGDPWGDSYFGQMIVVTDDVYANGTPAGVTLSQAFIVNHTQPYATQLAAASVDEKGKRLYAPKVHIITSNTHHSDMRSQLSCIEALERRMNIYAEVIRGRNEALNQYKIWFTRSLLNDPQAPAELQYFTLNRVEFKEYCETILSVESNLLPVPLGGVPIIQDISIFDDPKGWFRLYAEARDLMHEFNFEAEEHHCPKVRQLLLTLAENGHLQEQAPELQAFSECPPHSTSPKYSPTIDWDQLDLNLPSLSPPSPSVAVSSYHSLQEHPLTTEQSDALALIEPVPPTDYEESIRLFNESLNVWKPTYTTALKVLAAVAAIATISTLVYKFYPEAKDHNTLPMLQSGGVGSRGGNKPVQRNVRRTKFSPYTPLPFEHDGGVHHQSPTEYPTSYQRIKGNTVSLRPVESTMTFYALALDSMRIMLPGHYVRHFLHRPDISIVYASKSGTQEMLVVPSHAYNIQRHPQIDLALLSFHYSPSDKIKQMGLPGIQHLFPQTVKQSHELLELVRYNAALKQYEPLTPSGFVTHLIPTDDPAKPGTQIVVSGLLVEEAGQRGWCGSPVMYSSKHLHQGHIFGMHIAADGQRRSIILPVTTTDLDILINTNYVFEVEDKPSVVARFVPGKSLPRPDHLPTGLPTHPFSSELTPAESHNLEHAYKARDKRRLGFTILNEDALLFARTVLSSRLPLEPLSPCAYEELLVESTYANAINLNASVGLSMKDPLHNVFARKKSDLVHYPHGPGTPPEFLPHVIEELESLDWVYNEPCAETTKVETIKKENRLKGKVRLFCVAGMYSLTKAATYVRPFSELLQAAAPESPVSVGIDPYSPHWDRLMRYLHKNLNAPSFLAGDKSAYDSAVPPVVNNTAGEIIASCFSREHYDDIMSYASSLSYSTRSMNGEYYQKTGGNVSGGAGTAVFNSLTNGLLFWYCFYIILSGHDLDPFEHAHLVNAVAYGDDDIQAVDSSLINILNMVSLQRELDVLGIVYTAPDKSESMPLSYQAEEVSYLKNGFSLQQGYYYPTYPLNLIFQFGTWYSPSEHVSMMEFLQTMYELALSRLACYPKPVFDAFRHNLDRNFKKMGIASRYDLTYDLLRYSFNTQQPELQSEKEDNNIQTQSVVSKLTPISRSPFPPPDASGLLNKEFNISSSLWTNTTAPFSYLSIKACLEKNNLVKALLSAYRYRNLSYSFRISLAGDPSVSGSLVLGYVPLSDGQPASYFTFMTHQQITWLDYTMFINGNSRLPQVWRVPPALPIDYMYGHQDAGFGTLVVGIVTPLESTNTINPSLQFDIYMSITEATLVGPYAPELQGPAELPPDPETVKNSSGPLTSLARNTHRFLSTSQGTPLENTLAIPTQVAHTATKVLDWLGLQKTNNISHVQNVLNDPSMYWGNPRGVISTKACTLDNNTQSSTDPNLYGEFFSTLNNTLIDLACKEGHWFTHVVKSSTSPGTTFTYPLAPSLMMSAHGDSYMHTPFSFVSQYALYWRGTTRVKFRYTSSNYVTTNLQISFSPLPDNPNITAQPGTYPSQLVSLTGTGELEVDFPYLHSREMVYPTSAAGFMVISVLNPPSVVQDLDSQLTLQAYVSATPDLQLYGPVAPELQAPIIPGAKTVSIAPSIASSALSTFSDILLVPRPILLEDKGTIEAQDHPLTRIFLAHRSSNVVTLFNPTTTQPTVIFSGSLSNRRMAVPIMWNTSTVPLINLRLPRSSTSNYDLQSAVVNFFPRLYPRKSAYTYNSTILTSFAIWTQHADDSSHGILFPPSAISSLPKGTTE